MTNDQPSNNDTSMQSHPENSSPPPPDTKKKPRPWLTPYQFPKGKSPNPGGRPKRKPLTAALLNLLDQQIPEDITRLPPVLVPFAGMYWKDVFAAGLALAAVSGDGVAAYKAAADRTDGPVLAAPVPLASSTRKDTMTRIMELEAKAEGRTLTVTEIHEIEQASTLPPPEDADTEDQR